MKKIFLVILIINCWGSLFGQFILPNYQVQKQTATDFYIRWEPKTAAEWEASLINGYTIEVYQKNNGKEKLINEQIILPLKKEKWDASISEVDTMLAKFYTGARDLIYVADDFEAQISEVIAPEKGKTQKENVDEFRLGFIVYSATFDFKIADMAGLGFELKTEKEIDYLVKVYTEGFDEYTFKTTGGKITKSDLSPLQAEFGNKNVNLKWKTKDYRTSYFGYYMEVSENGKDFTPVQSMPYVNMLDTMENSPEMHFLEKNRLLERNYKDYFFRLRGMDYFGMKSKQHSTVVGYGFDEIKMPPIITYADQTEDNFAQLNWKIHPSDQRLIDHFEIHRADSLEGEFLQIGHNLPATKRDTSIMMDTTSNYFKVMLYPKDGRAYGCMPVFVMGQDTTPPLTPKWVEHSIDSAGVVTITWTGNKEQDLWGYKLFRSDFSDVEFSNLNSSPLTDTILVDTINLMTSSDSVHYQILAADTRYNRSPFSEILSIKKPDIIPPITPVFREVKYEEDSTWIKVNWDNSGSNDVVEHQLFRKNITTNEPTWTLITTFDSLQKIDTYFDEDIIEDNKYAYLVTALDDDGLSSDPSKPYVVQVKNYKAKDAFKMIEVSIDQDNKSATITWELIEPEAISEIIVYKGKSMDEIAMYKIVDPNPNNFLEEGIKGNEIVVFLLKPVYRAGTLAKFSDPIEITFEK